MSMTPPPGWYRDPTGPHLERWWDGTVWTDHRRPPEAAAAPAPPPGPPVPPPGPPVPPAPRAGGRGDNRAGVVALATAGVVLVASIVTGAVLLGTDDDPGTRSAPSGGASSPRPTADDPRPPSSSPSTSEPPEDPNRVVDELNGFTLPLLDGWVRPEHVAEDDVLVTTDGTYDCPGGGLCRHGLVISRTATATDETSPEALAREDVEDAAEDAYEEDLLGGLPFGGIESHQEVKAGPVAVAGRAGYLVRWRVRTEQGPGGYVQSLVFPSTVGTESPVVVRYVFDAGEDGPPLADMERMTKGIRPVGDASTGGGVGSSIGPTD